MTGAPLTDAQARAIAYASLLVDRYRSYHDHKETMAYGGATLFIGGVIAVVVAVQWPPQWLATSRFALIASVTAFWLVVLIFVKWQLRRRRWAAMRLAGVERLLAKWIHQPPSEVDLKEWTPPAARPTTRLSAALSWSKRVLVLLLDYVWPLKGARPAVDLGESAYPKAFVDMWDQQWRGRGTEALFHEGLLVAAGWAAYAVLLIRSIGISLR